MHIGGRLHTIRIGLMRIKRVRVHLHLTHC